MPEFAIQNIQFIFYPIIMLQWDILQIIQRKFCYLSRKWKYSAGYWPLIGSGSELLKSWLRLRLRRSRAPMPARGAIHSTGYIRGLEDIGDLSELFKLKISEGDSSIA